MVHSTLVYENNPARKEDSQELDKTRRRFLTAATTVVGVTSLASLSAPFVMSWFPSERAQSAGAPVKFNLSKVIDGQQVTINWRGKPVFVVKRTPDMLKRLNVDSHLRLLRDPDSKVDTQQPSYAMNAVRSIEETYLVVIGICTHLGCVPAFRPEVAPEDLGSQWIGGYFCPCHGSRFDLAGRVFKNVPAPTNLVIPPYRYLSNSLIEVGVDT